MRSEQEKDTFMPAPVDAYGGTFAVAVGSTRYVHYL